MRAPLNKVNQRLRDAVAELKSTISAAYPDARFELQRAIDEPRNYDLLVRVGSADPDDVGDLVADRVVEMRVEQAIPIHVIPLQGQERLAEVPPLSRRQAG